MSRMSDDIGFRRPHYSKMNAEIISCEMGIGDSKKFNIHLVSKFGSSRTIRRKNDKTGLVESVFFTTKEKHSEAVEYVFQNISELCMEFKIRGFCMEAPTKIK